MGHARAKHWMIYGAYGYTGEITARLAIERGMRPVVAGRSEPKTRALADELGLEARVFGLDRVDDVVTALNDVDVVLHAAGPFSATSRPMVDACLASTTHYCDITGEIDVFEAIHARNDEAKAAGVSLIPGVGFDVVPTDCLAAKLAAELPDATHLELAFRGVGSASQGTTKTALENLHRGGRARIDGRLENVPAGWKSRSVPFADRERTCYSIPWGDVSTAFYSTKIPNIVVYSALPKKLVTFSKRAQTLGFLFGSRPVQWLLKKLVDWRVDGPDAEERDRSESQLWGEVRNAAGDVRTRALTTPEGYNLTADASLRAVERLLGGDVPTGSLTPSMAFGAEFVEELDGVTVH